MSKNNGALFSKTLFGYKKSNVNDYIRQADEEHAYEISRLKDEIFKLESSATEAESKVKELEAILESERINAQEKLQKVMEESSKKLAKVEKAKEEINGKLLDSESRAGSYIKLADAATLRAESAEAESALLSNELESAKSEIEELKFHKSSNIKRISELEELVSNYAAKEEINKEERRKYFVIKRPSLIRFIRRK